MKYTIVEGDTMRDLAETHMNDEGKWRTIWAINKGRMKANATPDRPTVGVEIDIPDVSKRPPPSQADDDGSDEAELYIGDKIFGGWKDVSIKRTIEAAAAAFTVGLTERFPGQPEPFIINKFDRCALRVGPYTVIDGYVDGVSLQLSRDQHSISVSGRDKTCDIVDCSNIIRPGTWKKKKIEQIAQDLCDPFGIEVTTDVDTGGPIPFFRIQPGETIFEALEKECKKKNLFMTSLPDGRLIFSKHGQNSTGIVLQEGENILDIRFETDGKSQFSIYEVEGYPKKKGDSDPEKVHKPGKGNGIRTGYEDPDVNRYRPTSFAAEGVSNRASATLRAQWEAKVRAARADSITVTVQGWRVEQLGCSLWPLNHTVIVKSPTLRIDRELLITGIDLKKSAEDGTTTTLTLKRPDAYEDLPKMPKGRGIAMNNKVDERFYRPMTKNENSEKAISQSTAGPNPLSGQSPANPTWQWKKDA